LIWHWEGHGFKPW